MLMLEDKTIVCRDCCKMVASLWKKAWANHCTCENIPKYC